ncbi:MAG: NUDIX hydrolase [Candidatus Omnitrophota bacterium]
MNKVSSRKKIFGGKLINLYFEKRRLPNSYVASLEIVRHPGAVLIVPFIKRDEIVLIKQYRPVINSYIWELPAGTLHKNENPLSCAKRELVEEIGYVTKRWKRLGYIYPAPGYTTEKILIFEARGLRKVERKIEKDEIISPEIFSKREIIRLLRSGKIVDAKTISALSLARVT